jgi:lipopolysaccharide transport system ATP-binding protein
MQDEILTLEHVSKEYRLGTVNYGTLRKDLQSFWAKIRKKEDPNRKIGEGRYGENGVFLALSDVSLSVKRGETLGIIGRNGAGKSTLLKLLSRITAPTAGEIRFYGRMASMLEVGTGFHPELTGRENIYLNGAILGMKRGEIDQKVEKIIDFSECREFIDTPVKRYSSGMLVKLAFSVAAHLDGEILLMDEVLSVGDLRFREKSKEKMKSAAKEEGRTVLCVSHNMDTIRDLCGRCIVLEEGKKVFDGNTEEAIGVYNELCGREKNTHQ